MAAEGEILCGCPGSFSDVVLARVFHICLGITA
uniref:Uncharacterized protein n=1 Tax=Siphoviridae sp. ctHAs12 TaxID=2827826 RepID=A0A8S5SIL4_9CAUD|nr:MAG TPA: hypothetical protein [Siphoviridae sp. ctHAs12]DAU03447.1 MAG TPA: hypothetical protein [Caudoviricetes sp.]